MHEPQPYILIIDDDDDDRELLSTELRRSGIMIKDFASGEKAFFDLTQTASKTEMPSLIILDYNMPRFNGQELLSVIKRHRYTSQIPVILYSTTISPMLRIVLMEMGAFDCFIKPANNHELCDQLDVFKSLFISFTRRTKLEEQSVG